MTTTTTIDPGVPTVITAGNDASFVLVSGTDTELDLNGGASADATTVVSGGLLMVDVDAVATGTTISNGGEEDVVGGAETGVTIAAGGVQVVTESGSDLDATISGGAQTVETSATATDAVIQAGGFQYLDSLGSAVGTDIVSGTQVLLGGEATGTTVEVAGTESVQAGFSFDAAIYGAEDVSGGLDQDATINAGGVQTVSGTGVTSATMILDGGTVTIGAGGLASETSVAGILQVSLDGTTSAATIGSGGVLGAYGQTSGTTILSGGLETVYAGAADDGTVIGNGGTQSVLGGAAVTNATIGAGGLQDVMGGASVTGALVSGGAQTVEAGATVMATAVTSGGFETVSAGGLSISAAVGSGGTDILLGGTASNTSVGDGGIEIVQSGGLADGTTVQDGGSAALSSGGVASALTIAGGGSATVFLGGVASMTTVATGADFTVIFGGTAATVTGNGGSIVNTGLILGTIAGGAAVADGAAISGAAAPVTVTNDGTIAGVTDGSSNGAAIELLGGGTITNFGLISGAAGLAIVLDGGAAATNLLVIEGGSTITGVVSAGSLASNTLELAAAIGSATLADFNTDYLGFQTLQVDPGATWDLAGTVSLGAGVAVENDGTLLVASGDQLTLSGGVAALGTGGAIAVQDGATVTLGGAVAATQAVVLTGTNMSAGSGSTLVLADPAQFAGTISGFARGDTIDLAGLGFGSVTVTADANALTVSAGGATETIQLGATFGAGSMIGLSDDGTGGTDVRLVPDVTVALADDTGASASDGITSDPALTGTAEANSTVVFSAGGMVLGSVTADGSGDFSFTPGGLADGGYTLVATETDANGNVGSATLNLTLDTAPPAAPTIVNLDAGSDTGNAGDFITDIASPTITGTAEAGSFVTLSGGGMAIGTATADGSGNWSIVPGTPLTLGVNSLTATAVDEAGNGSSASAPLVITLDALPDVPGTPVLTAGSDSGAVGDGLTNVTTPVISGTGDSGDTVFLLDGANPVGSAVVTGGVWSITAGALASGTHALTATEIDPDGNPSVTSSTALVITVDTSVPLAPGTPALIGGFALDTTDVPTPSFSGTAPAGDLVTLYDGDVAIGSGLADGGGQWTIGATGSLSLGGGNTLTATATNGAGTVSPASAPETVTLTAGPPAPGAPVLTASSDSGVSDSDGITNVTTPVISGTGAAGDTVTLYDGGVTSVGTAAVDGSGLWSLTASALGAGPHALTAVQTDTNGYSSAPSGPLAITILTSAATPGDPMLTAGSDSGASDSDGITNVTSPVITGTGSAGDSVTLSAGGIALGSAVIDGGGHWSVTAGPLSDGAYSVSAVETDIAGNVAGSADPLALVIDTAIPATLGIPALATASDSGVSNTDGITNVTSPVISGTGTAGETVTLSMGGVAVGSAVVDAGGGWAITVGPLAAGTYAFSAVQTEIAGNQSTASSPLAVTIETAVAAPATPFLTAGSDSGVSSTDGITSVATPVITGTGVAGDTVTLLDGASVVGSTVVAAGGGWSVTTSALGDGAHLLTATQADLAGNISGPTAALALTIETTVAAPGTPVLTTGSDSGFSDTDGITNVTTPVITGTGVAGDTVTLLDGASVVGSTVVAAGGGWSVTTSALGDGAHLLTATQADLAGNISGPTAALALTIETTVAAPGTPVLTTGSDSGFSDTDGITNVTTPVITGTGVAGDTVTLLDGSTVVSSTVVAAGGGWSITTSTLGDGAHVVTATQADLAGNISGPTAALALTIETTVAAPGTPVLTTGSDSGVSDSDGITSVTTPVITGTGVAGDTITLLDGSTVVGSDVVAAGGTWSITTSALGDGAHLLTATQADLAGNISGPTAALALTIETTVAAPGTPVLTTGSDSGFSDSDGITNVTTPVITGTGVAGDTVTLLDGSTVVGSDVVAAGGTWSITTSALGDGAHLLTATQADLAGNISGPTAALALTIETTVAAPGTPVLTAASDSGFSDTDGITNVTTPVITGTGVAGDTITLLLDGSTVVGSDVVAAGGTWSITTSALGDGAHLLTATQADLAGNISGPTAALALTIETTVAAPGTPVLTTGSDSGVSNTDGITNVTTPVITGTGVEGDTITLLDGASVVGSAVVAAGGTWSVTTGALAAGSHTLTATQADLAGNISTLTAGLALTIETTVAAPGTPVLTAGSDSGISNTDGITSVTTPVITGTGVEGDTITLLDGSTVVGSATVAAGGGWSVTTSALGDGAHLLTATQADLAGNISGPTAALALTIETTVAAPGTPVLTAASDSGFSDTDGITNVTTPVITGTGVAGDTITLLDGASVAGSAVVAAGGGWSITTRALAAGSHTLTATQADLAGNISTLTAGLALTIETIVAAPSTPVLTAASDSGISNTDGITSVTTPVIAGTGVAGDAVTLLDGSTIVGSATVAEGGGWSVTTSALAAGSHTLTATQADLAGNISGPTLGLALTVETAVAAPGTPVLTAGSDSGVSNTDGITNVTTPVITGTGVAGDTVTLHDGSSVVGIAAVAAGGGWSITTSTLGAGSHTLTATQADLAGNISGPTTGLALTIETAVAAPSTPVLTAGSDSGISNTDGITSVTTPVITGTGIAGDTVTLLDGASVVGSAVVAAGGTWSVTTGALAAGSHTLTATQADLAGNISTLTAGLALTIETTVAAPGTPVLTAGSDSGISSIDGITNVTTPVVTGTGVAGDTVTLLDGVSVAGSAVVAAGGTWSVTTGALAAGSHTLTATQADLAGNISTLTAGLALTIETTVAAPGTPVLTAGSDSGISSIDGITNVTTPVVTGTGVAGDTVTLLDGASVVGSAVVAAGGTWSVTTGALAAGSHTLTATQADLAGNISTLTAGLALTIETTVPTPGTPVLTAGSDSGVSNTDGITSVTTPVITGTGVAGDAITLHDGASVVGSAVVAAGGTWSITTGALAAGSHTLTATQADLAGNISTLTAGLALTIETTVAAPGTPVLTAASDSGGSNTDGITNVTTPVITGTGVAGDTVTLLDGSTVVGSAVVAGGGTWSITASALAAGSHTLTAIQADLAGNRAQSAEALSISIQTALPASPAGLALAAGGDSGTLGDGVTDVANPTISGTAPANSHVRLFDGGTLIGSVTAGADGAWSILATAALVLGTNSITASATDGAGNVSPLAAPLVITRVPVPAAPAGLTLLPASDSGTPGDLVTDISQPVITGTGAASSVITLYDGGTAIGSGTASASGAWTIAAATALLPGSNALTATATDPAGDVSAPSSALVLTLVAAPLPPAHLALDPATDSGVLGDEITAVARPVIDGTAAPSSTITLFNGSAVIGSGVAGTSGAWSVLATAALAPGGNALTATATDSAGDVSSASTPLAVTLDLSVPAVAGLTLAPASDSGVPGDNITNVAMPTITGTTTAAAGSTIRLYASGSQIGTALSAANGTWSVTAAAALAAGSNSLTATATTIAGNVSAVSPALTIIRSSAAPPAPTALMLAPASDSGIVGDGVTDVALPSITGMAAAMSAIALYDGGVLVGSGTAASTGAWSITVTRPLAAGGNLFTGTATDIAGNVSTLSTALAVTAVAPPASPASVSLDGESDSGIIGDNITDIPTPSVTGAGTAGDIVTLLDGTAIVGTAVVAASGAWSLTPALAPGLHTLTATQTDAAGDISAASAGLALTILPPPPLPTGIAVPSAIPSGRGFVTSGSRPLIAGFGTSGDTITLLEGDVALGAAIALGTAVVTADGLWSLTPAMLAPGLNTLQAIQTDAAGDASAPATLNVTVDQTTVTSTSLTLAAAVAPTALGIPAPVNPSFPAAQLTITVAALPTDGTITLATGAAIAVGQALSVGQLTSLLFTPLGSPTGQASAFSYTVADPAGISVTGTVTVTVTPATAATPQISASSQTPDMPAPSIAGHAVPDSAVTLLSNGVAVGVSVADPVTGAYSITASAPLPLGLNRLTVSTVSADGATSVSAPLVIFDVQTPVAGTSTTDFSSADIGSAIQQGAQLNFISGTQAVQLTDATLSVGTNTSEAMIQRLYVSLLGRGNDTTGISFYDAQLIAGASPASVAAQILASPEYIASSGSQTDQQFIAAQYENDLGRSAASDPNSSFWTGLLAQGESRADVAVSILDASEAKANLATDTAMVYVPHAPGTLAHELYETGLGREVDLAALANFNATYNQFTPAQFAAQVASSAEFIAAHGSQTNAQYVDSLYEAGLGRPADSGAAFWTGMLTAGTASRAEVLLGIATGAEATAHLTYNLNG